MVVVENSFRAGTGLFSKSLVAPRSEMRPVGIMCTHAAECSLAGSQPAEGSGSSPSPPWALSPALSPLAVRLGPFPLVSDTGLGWEKQRCRGR